MKVVYHIDEMEKWDLLLANVRNMCAFYEAAGHAATIEVVATAAAVRALTREAARDSGRSAAFAALQEAGVLLAVCANALAANGVGADALVPSAHVVPAGVVELAQRQQEGYAYIKP